MFACEDCLSFLPLSGDTLFRGGAAQNACPISNAAPISHAAGDPVWHSLKCEASDLAQREPVMARTLQHIVTSRDSIAEGLVALLSQRLANRDLDEAALFELLQKRVGEDVTFASEAEADLLAIGNRDPAVSGLLHPMLNFKGFHAIEASRIAHRFYTDGRKELAFFLQNRISDVFGVDVHPAAKLGRGILFDHATGIVIGETAVVGNDVTILHGVTLGGTGKTGGDRHPKVGNGVFIGASCQLLGNISIGDDVKIGAGSVVLKDVDSHCTVAGVPAKVVRRNDSPAPAVIPFRR